MNKPAVVYGGLLLLAVVGFVFAQFMMPGHKDGLAEPDDFVVLAHRGMHTNWDSTAYDRATGCEATHIYQPTHDYIENTIPSIEAAFSAGANMVEIDIRPSADGVLMLNHEEDLECKTDGHGKIYELSVDELKMLDVGYGFTADDGHSFPFRGKGGGLMPTLAEVLQRFPDKMFLIDHKDRNSHTSDLLISTLLQLPREQREHLYYWGSPEIADAIVQRVPEMERLLANRSEMKRCLTRYVASLGFAGFGSQCQGLGIAMNRDYATYIPGWPYRFIRQARANGSEVYLLVDSLDDVEWARDLPVDGIITDYVEIVGPAMVR